jgi:hypothetical protein
MGPDDGPKSISALVSPERVVDQVTVKTVGIAVLCVAWAVIVHDVDGPVLVLVEALVLVVPVVPVVRVVLPCPEGLVVLVVREVPVLPELVLPDALVVPLFPEVLVDPPLLVVVVDRVVVDPVDPVWSVL